MTLKLSIIDRMINGDATLADQEEALKDPYTAYHFALWIPGANIEKCQEEALKDPCTAYLFAYDIPGADIEKCQKVACKASGAAYFFARHIPKADMIKCIEACKGTEYEDKLNQYLMNKALQ